jgi:hypothetical protein
MLDLGRGRKPYTHEEFVERVRRVHGDTIEVLGRYTGGHDKIEFRCCICGNIWSAQPTSVVNLGSGCSACRHREAAQKRKMTHEQYVQRMYERYGNTIEVLSEYKGSHEKVLLRHNVPECGREFEVYAYSSLNRKVLCKVCADKQTGLKRRKTHDEFVQQMHDKHGDKIVVIGMYVDNKTDVELMCAICGCRWSARPDNLLKDNATGCPECGEKSRIEKRKLSHEEFVEKVKTVHGDSILVLGEYDGTDKKILVQHNVENCSHKWMVTPHCLISKESGCPVCYSSKGESLIRRVLNERNVQFVEQYTFPDCKYKKRLRFDFAVFHNDNLTFLVEYDGKFHHELIDISNDPEENERNFYETQIRDRIKNEYCAKNNIPLLRIPYWKTEEEVAAMIDNMLIRCTSTDQAS